VLLASLVAGRKPQWTAGVQSSRECTPPYLSTGISNLLQPAQVEVVLSQHSSHLVSWVPPYSPSTVGVYSPVYSVYIMPCTNTRSCPCQYSPRSAPSDIFLTRPFTIVGLVVLLQFFAILLLSLASFGTWYATNHLFFPLRNKSLSLPDLKENSGENVLQDLLPLKFYTTFFYCK
jgi:hypothetical protein